MEFHAFQYISSYFIYVEASARRPKGRLAIKLCLKALEISKTVQYCLFHDVTKTKGSSIEMLGFTCCAASFLELRRV